MIEKRGLFVKRGTWESQIHFSNGGNFQDREKAQGIKQTSAFEN